MSENRDQLFECLEAARVLHAKHQKHGAIAALLAVIDYLENEGAMPGHILPLRWLGYEFTQDEIGKPLFKAGQDAIAAAAVDLLLQTGLSQDEACNRVARATGSVITGSQLKTLRKNFLGHRQRPEAIKQYEQATKAITGVLTDMSPDQSGWENAVIKMVAHTFGNPKV